MSLPTPTSATVRLIALALCAAVFVLEHLRLAIAARRGGAGRVALALLVPGIGAAFAWQQGRRAAPTLYASLAVAYLVLRFAP